MYGLSITFIGHSGFLVETDLHFLLFDLYRDEAGVLAGGLPRGGDGAVFISHSHADHFNPSIFGLGIPSRTTFIADSGVRMRPGGCKAHSVSPYDHIDLGWGQVKVFGSTDEGCSFLVEADGWSVFHAGDLNDWYWRDESTPEELQNDEGRYLKELDRIKGHEVDVAFVPVDQRLHGDANRGAVHFAGLIKPRYLVPMHINGKLDLLPLIKEMETEGSGTQLIHLAGQGDRAALKK